MDRHSMNQIELDVDRAPWLRARDRTVLVPEDSGYKPLDGLLDPPMDSGAFLRLAIGISSALAKVHQSGLVHKDIKPANILVNPDSGEVRLTGFGLSSRLTRERQRPEPPESIAGTLAYMAPEQTGRMNRSIDARSDLYAFGVTLYQMLTGALPFSAADAMEWVHCHIARKPVPPSDRLATVPVAISNLVLKLLAKTAEQRYQTAAGLEREIETLLGAFDRVVNSGRPELVLVSGYSGIGKSTVVNELHKALVPSRALFAAGKFDQYKRDIPYATLAQAIQGLVRSLLGKSDAELAGWRDALGEALGANGRLVIDVVPELKLLIGEQPPVQELPPQQAQGRLQLVFRRVLDVV